MMDGRVSEFADTWVETIQSEEQWEKKSGKKWRALRTYRTISKSLIFVS